MELSSTSKTQWCSPRSSGSPIYIPGRFRTASKPSSLSILEASYFSVASGTGSDISLSINSISLSIKRLDDGTQTGIQLQLKNCSRTKGKDNLNLRIVGRRKIQLLGGEAEVALKVLGQS